MATPRLGQVPQALHRRGRKALSAVAPYRALAGGRRVFDAQYTSGVWDYLRSLDEAPRYGVLAAYCRALAPGGSVLEVGCGEGILLDHLGDGRSRFSGVDVSPVAIDRARERHVGRGRFSCADAASFVPDDEYGVVVFNEVLYYLDDPLGVVRRYEEHLTGDGVVVVSMFRLINDAAARHIWRGLHQRYAVSARTTLRTRPGYRWDVEVLARPAG
ncbi:class I SAM-dependent methyltransferase [Geodermatophilus sp. SYSU D00691]